MHTPAVHALKFLPQRCHCGMEKMLQDVKLDIKTIEKTSDYRFTAMDHAVFVAQMMQQSHEPEATFRLTKKPVETCGRQWNSCETCKGSKVFLCTKPTLAAAARRTMPLVVRGPPPRFVYAPSDESDSDSSYSNVDTPDSEEAPVVEVQRPELYGLFSFGR